MRNLDAAWFANANRRARFLWVGLFFLIYFVIGLRSYRDYNMSWDEPVSRNNGMITLKYLGQRFAPEWVAHDSAFDEFTTPLQQYYDRDYGVAFETPVSLLERLFHLSTARDIYLFRHLFTFLVCFGGAIALFQLAERRFSDWRLGLFAALWLILSPRLFADSFYNDKDAVFMALFAVAMNTGVRFLLRPTLGRAVWHALACAVTIDVRIMGVMLPLITLFLLGLHTARGEVRWRQAVPWLMVYAGLTWGFIVLFWPYLWPAPWENFVAAFNNMSKFRWDGQVLYFGKVIPAAELPWHYILTWIGISTPLLYLGSFVVGAGAILYRLGQRHWRLWQGNAEWQDLLFLGLFVLPIVAIIALKSVLYDGWRQVFFLYPAFLLVALRGWVALWQWRPAVLGAWWPRVVGGVSAVALLITTGQIIQAHPVENAYFNVLAGRHAREKFEVDYWGVSNLEAVRYIVAHDNRPLIKIAAGSSTPLLYAVLMLKEDDRKRVQVVEQTGDADYVVSNYRGHPNNYEYLNEIFQLKVGNMVVNSVFQTRW